MYIYPKTQIYRAIQLLPKEVGLNPKPIKLKIEPEADSLNKILEKFEADFLIITEIGFVIYDGNNFHLQMYSRPEELIAADKYNLLSRKEGKDVIFDTWAKSEEAILRYKIEKALEEETLAVSIEGLKKLAKEINNLNSFKGKKIVNLTIGIDSLDKLIEKADSILKIFPKGESYISIITDKVKLLKHKKRTLLLLGEKFKEEVDKEKTEDSLAFYVLKHLKEISEVLTETNDPQSRLIESRIAALSEITNTKGVITASQEIVLLLKDTISYHESIIDKLNKHNDSKLTNCEEEFEHNVKEAVTEAGLIAYTVDHIKKISDLLSRGDNEGISTKILDSLESKIGNIDTKTLLSNIQANLVDVNDVADALIEITNTFKDYFSLADRIKEVLSKESRKRVFVDNSYEEEITTWEIIEGLMKNKNPIKEILNAVSSIKISDIQVLDIISNCRDIDKDAANRLLKLTKRMSIKQLIKDRTSKGFVKKPRENIVEKIRREIEG